MCCCRQFVLLAGAAAIVEFCISMVLFSSHHQLASVDSHVRAVMRRPLPSLQDVLDLKLSEEEQQAFYHAMNWLDEMGTLDERRVLTHYFSWADQWHDLSDAISRKTLQILINNELMSGPTDPPDEDSSKSRPGADEDGYEPLCSRGRSSLRRRRREPSLAGMVSGVMTIGETLRANLNTGLGEFAADLSADNKWRSLTGKFETIWSIQNLSLSLRAYEIGVNQQCLYTIKIRLLQELKEVRMFEFVFRYVSWVLCLFSFVIFSPSIPPLMSCHSFTQSPSLKVVKLIVLLIK